MDDPLRDVRITIDRAGWHVQSVLADTPAAPTWTYTVGLHERGLPELLVFGQAPRGAYAILAQVRALLSEDRSRAASGVPLGKLDTEDGPRLAHLGAVSPRWLVEYPLWAFELYGPDVDVLQVVLSDRGGAFRGEPGYDPTTDHDQPDLSRDERPWGSPLWAETWSDQFLRPELWVLAPIVHDGIPEERDEALPAVRTGPDRARILQPAVLADHVTAGTEVVIEPQPYGVLTATHDLAASAHRMLDVTQHAHVVQLSYRITCSCERPEDGLDRLEEAVARFDPPISLSRALSLHLTVASPEAERARIAMRRLERDRIVVALDSYHAPPAVRDHPDCAHCRRRRGAR